MRRFNEIEQLIEQNKSNHDMCYYNCIPFDIFPRLERYIPGITQGTQYIITGATASAKSKMSRYLFIHNPYYYVKNNPQLGIDLDIHYFSLEESKEKIYLSEVSRSLKTKHNISVSINDLRSVLSHFLNRGDFERGTTYQILDYCYNNKKCIRHFNLMEE